MKMPAGQVQPPAAPTPAPAAPAEESADDYFGRVDASEILVSGVADGLDPAVEEAAILYANDQADAAISCLSDFLEYHASATEDPWLMLFELYQQQNRHDEFDELALKYVVRFERTAPSWHTATSNAPAQVKAAAVPRTNYLTFVGALNAESPKLHELATAATHKDPLKLDFTKFESLDPAAATVLQGAMQAARKAGLTMQLVDGAKLTEWLKTRIEIMRPEQLEVPFWLLLLELHQALGMFDEFENLAVDYAVTYEVSPPSWEALSGRKLTMINSHDDRHGQARQESDGAFRLTGCIVDNQPSPINHLHTWGAEHAAVRIDASELQRLDFISAGNLLNLLLNFAQQGKQVTIEYPNALVHALFQIMGIADVATVLRKK